MLPTIIITSLTCIAIVLTSIIKPSVKIGKFTLNFYWVIALIGALAILLSGLLPWNELGQGLTSNTGINPIQILILFISMSLISIFLDETGFFEYVAAYVLKHTKNNQFKIFIVFYLLVAILTMFTSNDIVILTLTPFIIMFTKNAKVSPIPYLVGEFVCANTWSMMFVIGNPTNIYLSQTYHIAFTDYFMKMAIPTLAAGILEFGILIALFYKKLSVKITKDDIKLPDIDRPLATIGLVILLITTVFLILSSYINLPMYLISAVALGTLSVAVLLFALIKKRKPVELGKTFVRTPLELIPFVLGMFVIALSLQKYEVTSKICQFFGSSNTKYIYGYSSMLVANLVNNIPMSVIYSSITSGLSGMAQLDAIYGSIIGSNIGAFLTPIGALAGIMWMNILKKYDIKFTFLDFMKYGCVIGLPVATIAIVLVI